ncbi:DUF421 domain-containing protein [Paenibacillus qinlingensis]|uniref:Uncharacterized membrane protein YcaP (DUF421 family) n=1 Tax=Paenibacillus qinlingensis TaxID=1837343 RepID=A0ABU1NYJ8_9BACL|nr:DUF421 domain-containing protein [Paenibacillus qinlingensis]MDR6552550.1 uncharacterized membrane protein YcaP (DUF421 family) [Paenibacillus qinlingensis]
MDFFRSQESLTTLQWILRAIVGYFFLLITAKALGQRSISQLRFLDFVIALILGNIMAHPLSDEHLGLYGSMITTVAIVVLYLLTSWLSLKWNFLKHLFEPSPLTLIEHGQLRLDGLRKAKISVNHLFSELRKQQVEDIEKVALALWEPGGMVSVFLEPQHQTVTAKDMAISSDPFSLVKPLIIQGAYDTKLLAQHGKDLAWLEAQMMAAHVQLEHVMLATIDDQDHFRVYTELDKPDKDELMLH